MTHSKFLQAMQAADAANRPAAEGQILAYLTGGRVTVQVGNNGRPIQLDTDQAVELAQHIRGLAVGPEVSVATECRHCTVPVAVGDVCDFCKSYTPPDPGLTAPQRLDAAVNRIDLIRNDINAVIRELPDESPMFAIVDIVNALWNLRNAAVLLDKATDTLEADAAEVTR